MAVVSYWWKDVHLVLVDRVGSLPRNSVVRLSDRLDMTIVIDWDVKQQIKPVSHLTSFCSSLSFSSSILSPKILCSISKHSCLLQGCWWNGPCRPHGPCCRSYPDVTGQSATVFHLRRHRNQREGPPRLPVRHAAGQDAGRGSVS